MSVFGGDLDHYKCKLGGVRGRWGEPRIMSASYSAMIFDNSERWGKHSRYLRDNLSCLAIKEGDLEDGGR